MRCRAAIGSPVIPTPCCYHNYSDVGLTKMCASAFPRGDCVQPRPSFTVASSKVTLSRCGWTMFTSSWCCEQNVFNLWIKSLFFAVSHHVDSSVNCDHIWSCHKCLFLSGMPSYHHCSSRTCHCKQLLPLQSSVEVFQV